LHKLLRLSLIYLLASFARRALTNIAKALIKLVKLVALVALQVVVIVLQLSRSKYNLN
jgi:hypothetical protein